ncbi:PEP-CTERM sorting domain-containing protein [Telluria mixta]|uniref:PEP-CTERM sorting domain-containing protein n=1 Tax=Telluria mixta TaxID=34071 RepID=A0ABT2C3R5_9BURK|nr:PEP-CTERM sorting domain-containing protein [Telluria mixta]MCS0632024.1 PEP-CTERM sorting domain-containing protein [Telluria mixta]WEM95299.1 PEP-CTERM sorting domain-containing protein [Telluria mixta]
MTTRYLIAAALLVGSACGAQAEVLSATGTAAQSGFLSGWTSGNGSDVVSSGVLSNGVSLVGGAAYGSGNLAEALYQKASASVGQTGTQVKLSYSQGIEGTYLLSTSNAKLAAMLGNGKGVVSTADGKVITTEAAGANNSNYGGGGSNASAPSANANPPKGSNSSSNSDSVHGAPSGNYDNGNGATVITPAAGGQEGGAIVQLPIPAQNNGNGNGNGNGGIGGDIGAGLPDAPAAPAAAVPEPSSIALMMAGMLGAMGIVRRRKR